MSTTDNDMLKMLNKIERVSPNNNLFYLIEKRIANEAMNKISIQKAIAACFILALFVSSNVFIIKNNLTNKKVEAQSNLETAFELTTSNQLYNE